MFKVIVVVVCLQAVCALAASAAVPSDCETVLPAICKLNGPGAHCHPCVDTAYVDCSDKHTPELKTCTAGMYTLHTAVIVLLQHTHQQQQQSLLCSSSRGKSHCLYCNPASETLRVVSDAQANPLMHGCLAASLKTGLNTAKQDASLG